MSREEIIERGYPIRRREIESWWESKQNDKSFILFKSYIIPSEFWFFYDIRYKQMIRIGGPTDRLSRPIRYKIMKPQKFHIREFAKMAQEHMIYEHYFYSVYGISVMFNKYTKMPSEGFSLMGFLNKAENAYDSRLIKRMRKRDTNGS